MQRLKKKVGKHCKWCKSCLCLRENESCCGICSEAAGATFFSRLLRDGESRLYFPGPQIQLNGRESTFASAGCRGLQMVCCDPFTKWKEKTFYVQHEA